MANVRELVAEQCALLQRLEVDIQARMRREICRTQLRELAVCERVVEMIQDHITSCEPIAQEWLVAPDAISLTPSHAIYEAPALDPTLC